VADKDSVDLLMTFIEKGGKGVPAESTTQWDPAENNDMMKDFQPHCVFEVDDFTFVVNLSGNDDGGADNSVHRTNPPPTGTQNMQQKTRGASSTSQQFAKYIESGTINYKAEVQPVTITRQIDKSSIQFLQHCFDHKNFEKAVLVKRKFTGGRGEIRFHEAFLRLEFTEPLITGIEWDEGDVVREKMTFVCRGIKAAYKPQKPTGELGGSLPANWTPPRKLAGGSSGSS
jgi:type VI protein secretion system component Hcp